MPWAMMAAIAATAAILKKDELKPLGLRSYMAAKPYIERGRKGLNSAYWKTDKYLTKLHDDMMVVN